MHNIGWFNRYLTRLANFYLCCIVIGYTVLCFSPPGPIKMLRRHLGIFRPFSALKSPLVSCLPGISSMHASTFWSHIVTASFSLFSFFLPVIQFFYMWCSIYAAKCWKFGTYWAYLQTYCTHLSIILKTGMPWGYAN